MRLSELVQPQAIMPELAADDRNGAIRELVQCLAHANQIPADAAERIARSIIARERTRGTTGLGKGMAVPHAKVPDMDRVVMAIGRSESGLDFQALDGGAVHVVFLLVSPEDQAELHLQAMNVLFRQFQDERFRRFLRQASDSAEIYELLKESDEQALTN